MKSFKKYMQERKPENFSNTSDTDPLNEGVLAGSVITAKLNSMRNKVKSEQDLAKKIDLLADMITLGSGAIGFAVNYLKKKKR